MKSESVITSYSIHYTKLYDALSPNVAVASIMWANNETGAVFPIAELAEIAHAAGVLFLV